MMKDWVDELMGDKSKIQNPLSFFPQKFKADVPLRIEIQIYRSYIRNVARKKFKNRLLIEIKVTNNI